MLKDKVVLVSGGTGAIGSAICRACADYGARVFFTFHKKDREAQDLASSIEAARALPLDLRDLLRIEETIEEVSREAGGPDVLINNAGSSQVMPFAMIEEKDFDLLVDVNVKGTFFLTKAVVRKMVKHKTGAIVNIGSIAGHRILDVPVHYALSKAALAGFTCSLAAELKRFGIRVNSVIPGLIEGGISRNIPQELKDDFTRHCTIGRPGTPREVAELVCFLASDKASYVNGQNIFVDGGI